MSKISEFVTNVKLGMSGGGPLLAAFINKPYRVHYDVLDLLLAADEVVEVARQDCCIQCYGPTANELDPVIAKYDKLVSEVCDD